MWGTFLSVCLLLETFSPTRSFDFAREHQLQGDQPARLDLLPESITKFTLENISSEISYVVFHIHSQYKDLIVSSEQDFFPELSTTPGSDRGIVTVLAYYETETSWYVNSSSSKNVSVIAMATTYTSQDPLAGGCNQEFNMENNANVHLTYDAHSTLLQFQFSNLGHPRTQYPYDCEAELSWKNLTYDLYLYYLQENNLSEETYFSGLERMMSVDSVLRHGSQITPSFIRSKHHSNFTIASYLGRGAIYAVVVTYTGPDHAYQSMYIPATTYACEFEGKVDNCEAKHNVASWILCTFAGIVGLFICFVGHRFFKSVMFLWGFLSFLLIFFILFTLYTELSFTVRMIIAAVFGLLGGGLWLSFWWFVGVPVVAVLLAGLNLGYVFSSCVFFTPFGNMEIWKNNFNYGMTFTCGVLILPVFILYFTKVLHILSCTVVGSYGVAVAINSYIHGSLAYIVVNSVKRAVNEEFNKSIMVAPFQLSEIILCIAWGLLAIAGTIVQFYRERGKPEFPACPHKVRKTNKRLHADAIGNDERAPLLVNAENAVGRRGTYGTDQRPEVM